VPWWEHSKDRKNVRGGGAYKIAVIQQALVAETMEKGLKAVLDDDVKMVKHSKLRPLNASV
jgi:hypothetical protein